MENNKVVRTKKKVNKLNRASLIVTSIAAIMLIGILIGSVGFLFLVKDKPTLDIEDFNPSESTIILDKNDEQVAELGSVIRQNVSYDDLPTSLIDAFVAVEDSRFFEHNGFDLPRFAKAILTNLKTMSFGSGASTFTMQLVKNTYFVNDDAGTGATKSLERKAQEIVLALELERVSSKKEIFTNYINKLNFGGTSQNIRGVQKAAQYYFGKDVQDLSLPESAMLAGVVNAPSAYNPYNNLELAQERRDQVLYLMNYHGYISDEEYELALQTKVEDFLVDSSLNKSSSSSNNGIAYQAYVDAVVEEVYDLTGLDPYTTSMIIHTSMDKDIQSLMDDIQAGDVDGYFTYPDDEFEVGSICVNNKTGEVIGVLGGRNYADGGSLLLNHATDQAKQPGSSIKPILVYSQAFEVLGWATSHVVEDRPLAYTGTDIPIGNSTNTFAGQVTLQYAVGMSLNTPAISTIRELQEAKGDAYLISYLQSMGFNIDPDDFDEQYAIGGKGLQVTCEQLAGAYAAMLNGGKYITPHTVNKIEFMTDRESITPTYSSTQVISEQAAYLTDTLLRNNVEGGYPNLMGILKDSYPVYAKTGTTNYGSEGTAYGIPNGAMKDGWVVGGTSEYTVATWMGYEMMQKDKISYMPSSVYNLNIKGRITNLILDKTVEKYGTPDAVEKPSGISSITHIIATFPYAAVVDGMDEEYITTGLIKSDSQYATLVSPQVQTYLLSDQKTDPTATISNNVLTLTWPEYPDKTQIEAKDTTYDISLMKSDGTILVSATGNRLFDYSWIFGTVEYKADIYINDTLVNTVESSTNTYSLENFSNLLKTGGVVTTNPSIKVEFYYGYKESTKKSGTKTITLGDSAITFNIPNESADYNEMVNALKTAVSTMNITLQPVTNGADSSNNNTVQKIEINGTSYPMPTSAGRSVTVNSLSSTAVIYYYSYSLSVSISSTGTVYSTNISGADTYSWILTNNTTGDSYTSEESSIDLSDDEYEDGNYTISVTVTKNNQTASTSTSAIK